MNIKRLMNKSGFTLIEMMIVLMIISVLLLIAVPNMTKNNTIAQEKGCEATIELLQAQIGAYQIEHGKLPTSLSALVEQGYVQKVECPNGELLKLTNNGVVIREK